MLNAQERNLPGTWTIAQRWPLWLPALVAAFYPYLLDAFHLLVKNDGAVTLELCCLQFSPYRRWACTSPAASTAAVLTTSAPAVWRYCW